MENVSELVVAELDKLVERGYINLQNKKYLTVCKPKLGRFYFLPKIHKRLENVPGRPVISNCGTATKRISEFLDFHIQPFVSQLVPSVIKDTTDFLKKLHNLGFIPNIAILCTIDVVGLYPHIPHSEGLDSLRWAMENFDGEIPVDSLVSLAKLVLENNFLNLSIKYLNRNWVPPLGLSLLGLLIFLWGH